MNKKNSLFTLFLLVSLFLSTISSTLASDSPFVDFYTSKKYLNHINKGYIYMDSKNYPLALKEFNTAQYLDKNISAAYECLGNIYEITKNNKEAMEYYQKAVDILAPKHSPEVLKKINEHKKKEDIKSLLELYKYILSIRPEAGLQMQFGDKSFKERNYEQALLYYKRAYELQEHPEKYLKIVQVKDNNKEYERYIVRKYLKNNLKYPEAHYKSGLIYYNINQYFNAINELKKALAQTSVKEYQDKYSYYLAMSSYKYGINNKEKSSEYLDNSIDLFNKYIKNNPKDIKAKFYLAESYFYRDLSKMSFYDRELAEAEKEFNKVASFPEKDPEYIDTKKTLDSLLEKKYALNMFDKSLDILNEIKSIKSSEYGVYYSLGNVYFRKGFSFYKGFYEKERLMDSKKANARDNAWNYYKKALEEYKKYIAINNKNDGSVYYDIGVVYYNASKLEPSPNSLPINSSNRAEYNSLGVRYYKKDMINRAINNFEVYLNKNGTRKKEVSILINELRSEYNKKG
ncbi:MAG: tetratricopeptide repeat protein [Candidatus Sericytochromatia bacterium]